MNKVKGIILLRSGFEENSSKEPIEKYLLIQETAMRDFSIDFSAASGMEWVLGIDPASKFTGLCMMDTNKQFIILLDCMRDNKCDADTYFDELYYLIKRLVSWRNIKLTVNEKPFDSKYSKANYTLIALRGKIDLWVKKIPELAASQYRLIYVNSWKSRIVDKSKGKNRYNQKGAVAEDLCDIFPALRNYYVRCSQGDLDSFDALGIILGYLQCAYTSDGSEKIFGDKEYRHNSFIGYIWENVSDITSPGFIQNRFRGLYEVYRAKSLVYNEDYSFKDNVIMASTSNKAVMTVVPTSQLQALQWKLGIDISEKGKALVMFIYRLGEYTQHERDTLYSIFDLREEMSGADA